MKRLSLWFVMTLLLLPGAVHATVKGAPWGYTGQSGPSHWGDLSDGYRECGSGRSQSPIDIRATGTQHSGPPIEFAYAASNLDILNNGHTIQVNDASNSYVLLQDKRYKLKQFHFHSPSENALNGRRYAMEMHLVHTNAQGALAVVGVFMDEGAAHPLIDKLWQRMPGEAGGRASDGLRVDPRLLLPQQGSYYHFQGSLTTPPCSEGVQWYMLKQPIEVSAAQIGRFLSVIRPNARPLQALNQRTVVPVEVAEVVLLSAPAGAPGGQGPSGGAGAAW